MVVLSVGTEPPKEAQGLAQAMGIELNPFGFCMTDKFTPLETSQPGVFVCGTFSSPKEIAETIIDASGAAGEVMHLMHDHLGQRPPAGRSVPGRPEQLSAGARCDQRTRPHRRIPLPL